VVVRSGFPEQGVRQEDELVAAEQIGTGAGGNVQQGYPRESKIPPQPAGGRRKRAHAVMAAVIHVAFYYIVAAQGRRSGGRANT